MEKNVFTAKNSLYTPIGKLMHDFSCTQPDNMKYPLLADRARYFKETEEGREIMCKAFEEVRDEGALQNLLKNVKSLMEKMDWSLEKTMEMLSVSDTEKEFLMRNVKEN